MRPYNEIAFTFNHFGELQVYQITVTMSHNYTIIMSHKNVTRNNNFTYIYQ